MGGQWNNPSSISYSFPPDGITWPRGSNSLNSTLNSEFGGSSWQDLVARALQTWASVTNLDFTEVGDGAYGFNSSGVPQGDQKFGDIRIGGSNYGPTSTIALTYGPPPNGQTGAGDVNLNTNYNFGPNGQHDFETIILHELGHSLGLNESPQLSAVMYSYYSGVRQSLTSYDIEGIQSIYGPRALDSFQSRGLAVSPSNAFDLTPYLNSSRQFELKGVSLASIGAVEYFSVVTPAISGSTLRVTAKASGFSLLSPKLSLIDAETGATISTASDSSAYGNLVSASLSGAQPGHRYLIAVTGATQDVFAVGSYAVQIAFSGGTSIAPPPVTVPNPGPAPTPTTSPTPAPTPAPVPIPIVPAPVQTALTPVLKDGYESHTSFATAAKLGRIGQSVVQNLTLNTAKDVRFFTFTTDRAGSVLVASENAKILVGDSRGRFVTQGTGLIGFAAPAAGARYFLIFLSPDGTPVPKFGFAVATIPSHAAVSKPVPVAPVTSTTVQNPKPKKKNPKVKVGTTGR
ncbi:matrixin family metalloprotease [Tundrisphaera lichenicola]|uniref:matrixin family metalloprotease n=1 Tax=Tundrisphaera lichenicola TaxID=2029860 RepID=UPI003EBB1334